MTVAAPLSSAPLNVPDNTARETLREQARQRQLHEQQEQRPDVRLQQQTTPEISPELPLQESPCFKIEEIRLTGKDAEKFAFALESVTKGNNSVIGRCLGVQGINLVMVRLQNAVIAKGFITTRILAAPQDLTTGVLKLTVIPGYVRKIDFISEHPARMQDAALPLQSGDILNLRDIEQALENIKRVPVAEVDFQIEPARIKDAQPGESDLVVHHQQGFPLRATLSLDDGGSKRTGRNQAGLTLSYDNPLSLNDLFYVSVNSDFDGGNSDEKGTDGYSLHYSVPYRYWLFSLSAGRFDFRQTVASAGTNIQFSGETKNADLRISRVLYRDARRRSGGYLRGYARSSKNFINDVEVAIQQRRTAGYEVGVEHREFIGKAVLNANLAYRHGTGAFNALAAPEDPFGEGASRPRLYTAEVGLNMPFTAGGQRWHYNGLVRLQHNLTPLVPQDRFSIGGRYTVRGFDGETVLSADRGWFIRNDIGMALGKSGQQLYAGLDYGEVDGQSGSLLLGKHLSGAVIGLRGGYKNMVYDVFAGRPVSRPDGFRTASTTYGFNVSLSF